MLNVSAKGCTISNTVSADSTYIGISLASGAKATGNTLYLLAGATGISLVGSNSHANANDIEGPTGTFRSFKTSASGTGNVICNNTINQPITDGHAGFNVIDNNPDWTLTNAFPMLVTNTGGNVEGIIGAQGPTANTSIKIQPPGTGAIMLMKAERNAYSGLPTIAAQTNAGSTATATVDATSTAIAGVCTITPGGTGIAAGFIARITWAVSPTQTSQIVLGPESASWHDCKIFHDRTATKARLDIWAGAAPTTGVPIVISWRAIEGASG
jgi:hypothetical protein